MKEIVISGFVDMKDSYGLNWKDDIFIDGNRLTDILRNLVNNDSLLGDNFDIDKDLGEQWTVIPDCNLRIYFTKDKCTVDEAVEALNNYMFGANTISESGKLICSGCYMGYSEYTITGFCIENLEIGGHDLINEFNSHVGEYANIVIS